VSTIALERRYTPEDLLTMPDVKGFELVDGELVERNIGWMSSWVGGRLAHFMNAYADKTGNGWVAPDDASYQCFPDAPDKVLKPDASYIRLERMPREQAPEGHCRIAPDVVVEVIWPNVTRKLRQKSTNILERACVSFGLSIQPHARSAFIVSTGKSLIWRKPTSLKGRMFCLSFVAPWPSCFERPSVRQVATATRLLRS
jgi:Uma2 family endonuclease